MSTTETEPLGETPTSRIATPAPPASYRSRIIRGAKWTFLGYGLSYILRFSSSLILTRLLFPEAYGLASLVWLYATALAMFSDVGIGPNIIRSERGEDPEFLDSAWTLQVIRGVGIWLCSVAVAWPLGLVYHQPQLPALIAVGGLNAVAQGLNSTALFTSQRKLRLGRLMVIDIVSQLFTLLATVVFAWLRPTVWALIVGTLVGSVSRMVMSHLFLGGHRHRLRWDRTAAHELFSFGRWVFVSSLITFVAMQSDRIVLGKLIPMREFGVYSIALMLAQIPRDLIDRLAASVVFPAMSQVLKRHDGEARVLEMRRGLLVISGVLASGLLGGAQPLVSFLYDPRYAEAGRFLGILAFGTWLQSISSTYSNVVLAAGQPKYISLGVTLRALIFFGLVLPVFHAFGVLGVAGLSVLSELGTLAGCVYGVRNEGLTSTLRTELVLTLIFLLVATIFRALAAAAIGATGRPLAGLLAIAVVEAVIVGAGALLYRRRRTALA